MPIVRQPACLIAPSPLTALTSRLLAPLFTLMLVAGCTIQHNDLALGLGTRDSSPLAVSVREALAARGELVSQTIDVTNEAGVITLRGRVDNDIQRDNAELAARRVEGVSKVINSLFVTD